MTHFGIHNFPATKYKIASGQIRSLCILQNLQGTIFQRKIFLCENRKKFNRKS